MAQSRVTNHHLHDVPPAGSRVRTTSVSAAAARAWPALVLAAGALLAGCGGTASPAAPSPPAAGSASLRVTAGPHVLIVTGNTTGGCTAVGGGVTAIGIAARVTVESDGSGWLARPAMAGEGDMVLRFRASGADTPIAVGLTGTASGTLTDASSPLGPPAGVRLVIDGQAELVGEQLKGATGPAVIVGEARGAMRFGEADRPLTTCTRVAWSLGPAAP